MKITLELDITDRELSDALEREMLAGRALAWKLNQLKGVHLDLSALHWVLVEAEFSPADERSRGLVPRPGMELKLHSAVDGQDVNAHVRSCRDQDGEPSEQRSDAIQGGVRRTAHNLASSVGVVYREKRDATLQMDVQPKRRSRNK